MSLKLWHNGTDWFIATTAEEAHQLALKMYGETDEEAALGEDGEWSEWPADKPLSITMEDAPEGVPPTRKMLPAEWISELGDRPGFLGSKEY